MNERYDFGRNWAEFSGGIDEFALESAVRDLKRLVGDIEGATFLDIGCGSGLHAAAALALGAARVVGVDYDTDSVGTSETVLSKWAPNSNWTVQRGDVLKPETLPSETFDIVYSWGVLHHTGDVWTAIDHAAKRVSPGARLALALYLETSFCGLWAVEKRLYSRRRWLRPFVKGPYAMAVLARIAAGGRNPIAYVRDYGASRGMNFWRDVDDWLGGTPYEPVAPAELEGYLAERGFDVVARFNTTPGIGLLGTGNGEWLLRRT